MALLGALERTLAICLHLGLTALVWQAVVRGSIVWVGIAVIWHASANAGALIVNQIWGLYPAEGFIALMAAISVYFLFMLRRREPAPIPTIVPEQPRDQKQDKDPSTAKEIIQRSLNDSRYLE
jgi:hypothetical protein